MLATLDREERPASAAEQEVLARWSSWGAVPQIFDTTRPEWDAERERLRAVLDRGEYAAARATTVNAHYTDPAYVAQIWQTLTELGFDTGRVLEPGAGSGAFIGMAPAGAQMTGVELDPTSAGIAAALYPQATIHTESFARTRYPAGHFDAVVGNVPFADVSLYDARYNRAKHSMHNHFIIKSLALTRPGGVVAVLTSRYTLDGQNPAARREMNSMADLVGAVRLPTGAHRRAAGTDAVTDLLIFRRREPDAPVASTAWETVTARKVDDHVVRVNSYFDHYPERILGELEIGHGMYGADTVHIRADDLATTPGRLSDALANVVAAAHLAGQRWTLRSEQTAEPEPVSLASEGLWDGHLLSHDDDSFGVVRGGGVIEHAVPATRHKELRALLSLRDAARALLTAEAATIDDTTEIDQLRAALRNGYEAYVGRFGPINRFTLRSTGRADPDPGDERLARVQPPAVRIFRTDPFAALVFALESFDETTQTASPATMMTERVIAPRQPVLGADTAEDALAVTMDTAGRVDLTQVARLLGVDDGEARDALGTLVFDEPGTRRLVPAAEYLSGNVRAKLAAAEAAAVDDPRLAVNVDALRGVLPTPLGVDEIEARLGAAWIDVDTHREFLSETLADPSIRVEHPGGTIWEVKGKTWSVAATSEWGTERMPAPSIAKAALEQRPIQITDEIDDKRVVNPVETAAANEKAAQLRERFSEWVWEDPQRADRLAATYNERFNSIVLRDYSDTASRLTLPGLARTFTPREHQLAAVARMISEPAVGLFHEVGAGKTAEMAIGTMELKRLAMVTKPVVVVPNHMLEQFSREWLQLYPRARLLAASSADLAGDKRRLFVARTASNDWDAVIMTRSAFQRIPVSKPTLEQYTTAEIEATRAMLENSRGGDGLAVKRLEKMVLAAESKLDALMDATQDPGITFEETGIDYVVVDEIHDYKNLQTHSNIRDAQIDGSKRASDLHMKLEYLRSRHGERVVTGATATPIANSVTEAHVMQRYLRPDLLEDAGIAEFDAWAATFGDTVTEMEMSPTGGYRLQTRFAKFQNVPEMLRMWHVFADVKTADDLQLPRPDLRSRPDGQRAPTAVVVPASPELAGYMVHLARRAEAVRSRAVESDVDNMLKISTDGRKAALDMRMVTAQPASTLGKLDTVADHIAAEWEATRDQIYLHPDTGQPSPVRGGLQMVFCDLGTPSQQWNAYDELRDLLTRRGLPRNEIRFIHEANNDADKARLFAAARAGHVAVLIGSTAKMGVGTNAQDRVTAMHHVDCPWRPADLAQRDGRGQRQGNQNPEIGIYRYVTEGSFDGYSWQTVERKAKFIAQIMRGRLDVREMEDIGDTALSLAEVKALAAGDPLILEQAEAQAELTRLERLRRAHQRQLDAIHRRIRDLDAVIEQADHDLPQIHAAIDQTTDTSGAAFTMIVDGRHYGARAEAAEAIRAWALDRIPENGGRGQRTEDLGLLGRLGGHTVQVTVHPSRLGQPRRAVLWLQHVPRTDFTVDVETLHAGGIGVVRQIENRITGLSNLAATVERQHTADVDDRDEARAVSTAKLRRRSRSNTPTPSQRHVSA